MIHRCDICGKRGRIGFSFRVAPIDAVGFVFLLLVSMVPVWLVFIYSCRDYKFI